MIYEPSPDLVEKLLKLTDGGAEFVVEATGAAPCIKAGWQSMCNFGKMVSDSLPISIAIPR